MILYARAINAARPKSRTILDEKDRPRPTLSFVVESGEIATTLMVLRKDNIDDPFLTLETSLNFNKKKNIGLRYIVLEKTKLNFLYFLLSLT